MRTCAGSAGGRRGWAGRGGRLGCCCCCCCCCCAAAAAQAGGRAGCGRCWWGAGTRGRKLKAGRAAGAAHDGHVVLAAAGQARPGAADGVVELDLLEDCSGRVGWGGVGAVWQGVAARAPGRQGRAGQLRGRPAAARPWEGAAGGAARRSRAQRGSWRAGPSGGLGCSRPREHGCSWRPREGRSSRARSSRPAGHSRSFSLAGFSGAGSGRIQLRPASPSSTSATSSSGGPCHPSSSSSTKSSNSVAWRLAAGSGVPAAPSGRLLPSIARTGARAERRAGCGWPLLGRHVLLPR
jgi:hypothetical protein